MNDRDALLKAICAHPDQDTPRLMFADWLDENGEPKRAEFIRLQVEWAKSNDPDLRDRQDVLLRRHGRGWLPPCGQEAAAVHYEVKNGRATAGIYCPGFYSFWRGFPEHVRYLVHVVQEMQNVHPPLHVPGCIDAVLELFDSAPLSWVSFEAEGFAPTVHIEFRKIQKGWYCSFQERECNYPLIRHTTLPRRDRRTFREVLAARLPDLFNRVHFRPSH